MEISVGKSAFHLDGNPTRSQAPLRCSKPVFVIGICCDEQSNICILPPFECGPFKCGLINSGRCMGSLEMEEMLAENKECYKK